MNEFEVTVPISAIAVVTVIAESSKDAIREAMEKVKLSDIDQWEPVEHITQGNVCYALQPWSADVVDCGPADD